MSNKSTENDSDIPQKETDRSAGLSSRRQAWRWIPSLYFAEGIPYIIVMVVAGIMFKRLGVSNAAIAGYTSLLYLPWVIKPLWAPLVDLVKTKRWWIVTMQLFIGAGLAGVGMMIPGSDFFRYSLAFLWLLAFSSATHDIAADGFYMLSLSSNNQAWFVGFRGTFYRVAIIAGQGLLVMFAGYLESHTGLPDATVEVQTIAADSTPLVFDPSTVPAISREGELRIEFPQQTLQIPRDIRSKFAAKNMLKIANAWNVEHGFVQKEVKDKKKKEQKTKNEGWFVALENFIRKNFGQTKPEVPDKVGNLGFVYITVAGELPEGEQLAIQFDWNHGDKNIKLVSGERFVVTKENQDKPMVAVVQLNKNLRDDTKATFKAISGNTRLAWASAFYLAAGLFLALCAYHFFALPKPAADKPELEGGVGAIWKEFLLTFTTFFQKKNILAILAFLLFYRFSEAQLTKIASLYLIDSKLAGGLGLTTSEVGFAYGTIGVLMLVLGGICGGWLASRNGLKAWIWWMVLGINIPNAVYLFLSYAQPSSLWVISAAIGIEQFGYGFGFAAYMLYQLYVAQGEHETAHFAICTGFMALGMMFPGAICGWLQELLGYQHFFIWILIATIPSFFVVWLVKIDPQFGKKQADEG